MEDLPSFPEVRKKRAFDDTKRNVVQLIEVDEGTVKRTAVTASLVEDYILQDFQRQENSFHTVPHESLNLFFSVRQNNVERHLTPIPISPTLFNKIAPYARIPKTYVDILARPIAMHVFARPQTPPASTLSTAAIRREYLSKLHHTKKTITLIISGFIMRSAARGVNGLCFGASFTYHFPSRRMYAFVHCYEEPLYVDILSAFSENTSHQTSLILPLFLLHVDMEERYKYITSAHGTLFSLERQAGIRDLRNGEPTDIDFTALSKDISYFIGNLALITWACRTMKRQLRFMEEVIGRYCALALLNGITKEEIEAVSLILEENLESLKCLNTSLEEQAESLSQRAEALIQIVYSGIAQRDASISQSAAKAAARDSAIMRIIAAITIFFLPATTVATFFGTSFFDFQVSRYEQVYSRWLWLYWVLTAFLTIVVLTASFFWWRRKERELNPPRTAFRPVPKSHWWKEFRSVQDPRWGC